MSDKMHLQYGPYHKATKTTPHSPAGICCVQAFWVWGLGFWGFGQFWAEGYVVGAARLLQKLSAQHLGQGLSRCRFTLKITSGPEVQTFQ